MCGLPSVTLLGEQSDWELIRRRINKLKTFDATANPQLHQWHALLVPIIDNFILTFSEPDSPTVKEFWSKIAHRYAGGSGPSYLSGWITAFCLFSSTGEWQGEDRKSCWGVHDEEEWLAEQARKKGEPVPPQQPPLFDAKQFPLVDTSEIPPSWCEVQVTIDDRRKQPVAEYKAMMVAGLVGCSTFSSENPNLESESPKGNDTVQPYAGWWIFRKDEEAEERDEKDRQRY